MSAKREDIVSAAVEVFHDSGLKSARMEQIAETARVSKRIFYMINAIYRRSASRYSDSLCFRTPDSEQSPILLRILTGFMQNPASAKVKARRSNCPGTAIFRHFGVCKHG